MRREPAWCDRVIWKGNAKLEVYDSVPEVLQSDHKPVCALFRVKAKFQLKERMEEVKKEIFNTIKNSFVH
jgi:hypothetical protein